MTQLEHRPATVGARVQAGRAMGAWPWEDTAVGEPPTILVADDSRLVRAVMSRALTAQGYRVLTTEDGVATVELAWSERPSLVLLDVEMTRMSGYQVTRLLRSEPRTADIPIVMFSSREAAG